MKFIYLICACALTFTTACNNQPAAEEAKIVETHTETIKVVEVEKEAVVEEERAATEVSVSPNSGSLKTKGLEVEINK